MTQAPQHAEADEAGGVPPGLVAGVLRVTRENGTVEDVPFTARIESAQLTTDPTEVI